MEILIKLHSLTRQTGTNTRSCQNLQNCNEGVMISSEIVDKNDKITHFMRKYSAGTNAEKVYTR